MSITVRIGNFKAKKEKYYPSSTFVGSLVGVILTVGAVLVWMII